MNKENIKLDIGEDLYLHLEKEAEKEVSLALQMPLLDEYRKEKYYYRRWLLEEFLKEFEFFEQKGLKITPLDIVNILFESKLLFATKSEQEFIQRSGGGSFLTEPTFHFSCTERQYHIDVVINEHFKRLGNSIRTKTLISPISNFEATSFGFPDEINHRDFFDNLFQKLDLPFCTFFDYSKLGDENICKKLGIKYIPESSHQIVFDIPSVGFTIEGSDDYLYQYGSAWLRVFFNMLRISGFIHHGQMNFGWPAIEMKGPSGATILGTNSFGGYSWDEDKKKPWEKIPDGCLFLSFGYRGLSNMYLDNRTFVGIEKFFLENKIIFENLKNPWLPRNLNDIEPALGILSSTTQIPDLGAKILLIYCCLEHLFVPKNIVKDNKKYIIGGINALKSDFLP